MKIAAYKLLSAVSVMLLSLNANAATHTFDYSYNGSAVTQNVTAAGSSLAIGDIVVATFHAAGNDYWNARAGDYIWAPMLMIEEGTRTGDVNWTYLRHGITVDTGNQSGIESSFVHIVNDLKPTQNISFDTLTWTYVLTASNATSDTFSSGYFNSLLTLTPATYVVSSVPEPETYAMLLAGLLAVGAVTRRRQHS